MSAQERLQRAIEATMAAGYQLNSEAFEFLIQNAQTNDPVAVMNLALEMMEAMQDKPMFIERRFLETVLQQCSNCGGAESQLHSQPRTNLHQYQNHQSYPQPTINIERQRWRRLLLPIRKRHTFRPQNPRGRHRQTHLQRHPRRIRGSLPRPLQTHRETATFKNGC